MDALGRIHEALGQVDFARQAIPSEAKFDHLVNAVRLLGEALLVLEEHSHAPREVDV